MNVITCDSSAAFSNQKLFQKYEYLHNLFAIPCHEHVDCDFLEEYGLHPGYRPLHKCISISMICITKISSSMHLSNERNPKLSICYYPFHPFMNVMFLYSFLHEKDTERQSFLATLCIISLHTSTHLDSLNPHVQAFLVTVVISRIQWKSKERWSFFDSYDSGIFRRYSFYVGSKACAESILPLASFDS